MRACDGDRVLAAKVLGVTRESLSNRIYRHPQLRAVWGQAGVQTIEGIPPPRDADVMNRKPPVLVSTVPKDTELAKMVEEGEREIHEKALAELGVGEKVLKRLRGLDKLASNTGQFLALSLEKTHRSYYLQLIELMEVAKDIHDRLMIPAGQPGYIIDAEERAWLNRNYAEMVKEAGRGYELMLTGTQAMVKMMLDTQGDDLTGKKKKHGWAIAAAAKDKDP